MFSALFWQVKPTEFRPIFLGNNLAYVFEIVTNVIKGSSYFLSSEKRRKMKWKSSKSVVKWSEVKCSVGKVGKTRLYRKSLWVVKWWEVKGWGESVSTVCVEKNARNYIQYFLTLVLFTFCTCCILRCLVCVVSCLVCIVVVAFCVLLLSYMYLLYYVCIAVFTLDVGLLAIS